MNDVRHSYMAREEKQLINNFILSTVFVTARIGPLLCTLRNIMVDTSSVTSEYVTLDEKIFTCIICHDSVYT